MSVVKDMFRFSLITGRGDQGGWGEVITSVLWASTQGIISLGNKEAGDTTCRGVGISAQASGGWDHRAVISSYRNTCSAVIHSLAKKLSL